ncbi:hypothetical protein CN203_11490 [Sinorhizobium meliloti]|uniref:hypothetical protein n=1 Tax=Rhizobium meliloti TaxID=382 RepID=UPI0002FA3D3C|nr:hypothetical protein [Sinorhizobium meliloti]RVH78112.1 hypothetical protein CN203_11490 [Sinorhizobium meliloti]
MATVPQNVLTRYAVVRSPRTMPEESLKFGLVKKSDKSSPLWDRLSALLSSRASSIDLIDAAKQYLDENSVNDKNEFTEAFTIVRDRAAALPSYNSPSMLVRELHQQSSPFEDAAKQTDFSEWLWDQLTARLIAQPRAKTAEYLVRSLSYLKVLETAHALKDGDLPIASAMNPEVVLPPQLTRFIIAARKDQRAADESRAEEIAKASFKGSSKQALAAILAGGLAKFIADALDTGDVEVEELAAMPARTKAAQAGVEETEDPSEIVGTSSQQALVLTGRALSRLPAEFMHYAEQELGIEDLKKADVLNLLQQALARAESQRKTLLIGYSPAMRILGLDALERATARAVMKEGSPSAEAVALVHTLRSTSVPTLPDFSNPNPIRVAGLCDLKVVRQQLQKYALGEIAYIENVLAGEERSRTHRRLDRTEQQLIFEVEESTSSERDLQTTDRFELNQELENVEKENKTTDAGVNVTGSYGAVTVAAHANFTSTSAAENAQKTARATVKENVAKAIDRVQKRTRRQETITVTTETTEDNVHRFVAAKDSVVGLYRYVEKHYWCQVYNYGARLMLEFLVPEPATSYRHYQAKAPRTDAHLIAPEPPNFLPDDVTESKYQEYAARYNAPVTAPPPAYRIANLLTDYKDRKDEAKLTIEQGYEAAYAYLAISFQYRDAAATLQVIMGANMWKLTTRSGAPIEGSALLFSPVRGELQFHVQLHRTDLAWTVGMTVLLRRTEDALKRWQLDTYRAIVDAYQIAKDEYEKKLAASQSKSRNVTLRTDLEYRNTERTELKRGVLELLTNQHFQAMGAIGGGSNGAPPIIDPIKALEEGPNVKFFEQAFEWANMTYTFYPYFWGRAETWEDRLSISDADPVFSRFLAAGYARVVVPVRRYFENNVKYYIEYGEIWEGSDCPLPGDLDYVSIIEEIKELEAAGSPDLLEGVPDGDPWRVSVPTPLVCLDDPNVKLPSWEVVVPNTTPYEPSLDTCNGVPYNAAQWPDAKSVVTELGALGYTIATGLKPDAFLDSAAGRRTVKAFQRRINGLGIAEALGSPLKLDGIAGPCTRRALTLAAEWRRLKQWPGAA